jgi:hypothetical protein
MADRPPFILSDYNIVSLSKNASLVKQFPFLQVRKGLVKRRCCGKPPRVDHRIVMTEMNRVRSSVLNLSQQEFVRFKRALGQDTIRLLFPNGATKDRS